MIEIYIKKGMTPEDATAFVTVASKYKELFVDMMMIDELGIPSPDPEFSPAKNGLATFLSFLTFGSVPVLVYTFFFAAGYTPKDVMFAVTCVACALTMFGLGVFKSKFTKQNPILSGLFMTVNGAIASASAYVTGYLVGLAVGNDNMC